jgi:hypothetical protein
VSSWDPNDKDGPVGEGADDLVSVEDPLLYTVYFENVAGAQASASQVVIDDGLPPELDPATVEFIDFQIGALDPAQRIDISPARAPSEPPAPEPVSGPSGCGISSYGFCRDVEVRVAREGEEERRYIVRVRGSAVPEGLLRWTFDTIEPAGGATDAPPSQRLSWQGAMAESYDVFLWRSSEAPPARGAAPSAAGLTQPSWAPAGLSGGTRYSWRVVARNRRGTSEASWSFETASDRSCARAPAPSFTRSTSGPQAPSAPSGRTRASARAASSRRRRCRALAPGAGRWRR